MKCGVIPWGAIVSARRPAASLSLHAASRRRRGRLSPAWSLVSALDFTGSHRGFRCWAWLMSVVGHARLVTTVQGVRLVAPVRWTV
jgi:hypothetical protein